MEERSGSKVAGGGIFIALGVIGGVIAGAALGQPSIGFLAGLGIGVALAVLTWLMTR
ncbi:MAG: hypothetical protein RLN87_04225 [Parasphingopyxis sp.]|uniref:hypothetical protein n=1 Tax=Parasphingopyxis sp. TaxID=1920299 RepID=UPI0032EAFA31